MEIVVETVEVNFLITYNIQIHTPYYTTKKQFLNYNKMENEVEKIDKLQGNDVLPCVINWVAVDERLPEIDKFVLCARHKTSMGGAKRITIAIGRVNKNGRFSCEMDWVGVDYWAELPESPCL